MDPNEPLTEEEVRQLILTFWRLDEEKAHLVDLMEVTAPDLGINMGEFADVGRCGGSEQLLAVWSCQQVPVAYRKLSSKIGGVPSPLTP